MAAAPMISKLPCCTYFSLAAHIPIRKMVSALDLKYTHLCFEFALHTLLFVRTNEHMELV